MVVENSPDVHNLIVCTLCSCYPFTVLGLPPVWYKSTAYRSRAVSILEAYCANSASRFHRKPRCASGTVQPSSATSSCPNVLAGTENMKEDELATLVTRDAMVGVAKASAPEKRSAA